MQWLWLFLVLALFISFYCWRISAPAGLAGSGFWACFSWAMVYVPFNASAWGIYVYIAAALPEVSESTNAVIGLLLLQCGSSSSKVCFSTHAWVWGMGVGLSLLIGMNRLRMEQKERADAKLRMAHEEIEQLAKTAERERIARDMHDILGHSLSLIVLKSELARRLLTVNLHGLRWRSQRLRPPRGKLWQKCARRLPVTAPRDLPRS